MKAHIYRTFFYKDWSPIKNKAKELQLSWIFHPDFIFTLFNLDFSLYPILNINIFNLFVLTICKTKSCDHAGLTINLRLIGLDISYTQYDVRHWDYDNNKWEEYGTDN